MSRSGYSEDCEGWDLIRWRGAVASAIRGRSGQAFMREMAYALDAMPEKSLIVEELEKEGQVCALGAVGKVRGMDMSRLDPQVREDVAAAFGIPRALAAEIMYENDDIGWRETPQQRWQRVRNWVQSKIHDRPERLRKG